MRRWVVWLLGERRVWACVAAVASLSACAMAQPFMPVRLLHPSGAERDWFGTAVAVEGDTVVIGSPGDDSGPEGEENHGSVQVFRRGEGGWVLEATLTAADASGGDAFGNAVAISGATLVVGAWGDDNGGTVDQGSAYVFVRTASTWTQQARLTAAEGAAGDMFGYSVAISGDTVVVGARTDDIGSAINQGSAFVFTRSGTAWTQQARLHAPDGGTASEFGESVAVDGDTVLVSASQDAPNGNRGRVYVFVRSATAWTLQAMLTAGSAAPNDTFGRSISLAGDTAVIGAPGVDVGGRLDQGSAYVFTRSGTAWTQRAQLTSSDGAVADLFGYGVSLHGNGIIVGAVNAVVGGFRRGAAYVFEGSGAGWTQRAKLFTTDVASGSSFGQKIGFDGVTTVIGAWCDEVDGSTDQGSAWVFQHALRCGTADFDNDGDTGTDADIEAFFACLAGSCCGTCWTLGADFNGDGDIGTDADIESFFRGLAGGAC